MSVFKSLAGFSKTAEKKEPDAAEVSRSDKIKVACDNLVNHTIDVIGTMKQAALEEFHKEACAKGYTCSVAEAEEAIVKHADLDDDLATLLLLGPTTFSEEKA